MGLPPMIISGTIIVKATLQKEWHHSFLEGPVLAQQLSRALTARGIHYAWFTAALTFCFSLAASTALTVPGVLIIPMSREFATRR
jgi:hypothetical protein